MCQGWALDDATPGKELELSLIVDGVERARIRADEPRGDVAAIFGHARHGFTYHMRRLLGTDEAPLVDVRVHGAAERLAGVPVQLTLPSKLASPRGPGRHQIVETALGRFLLPEHDAAVRRVAAAPLPPALIALFEAAADPERVAIDAGAGFGIASVALARLFARVVSFEPLLPLYYHLCANLLLNDAFEISPRHLGLFHHPAKMALAPAERQTVALPLRDNVPDLAACDDLEALVFAEGDGAQSVAAVTLDAFAGYHDVVLIRIGLPGLAVPLLQGAVNIMKARRPVAVFRDGAADAAAVLTGLDYIVAPLREVAPWTAAVPRENASRFDRFF